MTITIRQLTDRIRKHYQRHTEVTPELGEEIASFVRGQAEPHAVISWVDFPNGHVLRVEVTGDHSGQFPVGEDAYPTQIDALVAAITWAKGCGALTYEWLTTPDSGVNRPRISDAHDPDDLATITDITLDRHSSLWQVVKCLQNACVNGDTDIYSGDDDGTTISHEEVDIIVNHLTHGNEWSAIQYSDSMDMEEDT